MAALGADSATAQLIIADAQQFRGKAVIACYNSPSSVTISGDKEIVSAVVEAAKEQSIFARALQVDVAYHSHHMLGALSEAYLQAISHVRPQRISRGIKVYSSVSGELLEDTSSLNAEYWVTNMVQPVRFMQALTNMLQAPAPSQIIEVGPHSLLKAPITQTVRALQPGTMITQYLSTLVRGEGLAPLLTSMGKLWSLGLPIDVSAINQYPPADRSSVDCHVLCDIPTYPWSRARFLHESRLCKTMITPVFPRDPILGERIHQGSDTQPSWRNVLRTQSLGWMLGHKFRGEALLPYSGFVYMAAEAACQLARIADKEFDGCLLEDVQVTVPINVSADDEIEVVTSLRSIDVHAAVNPFESMHFEVSSYSGGSWVQNGAGLVQIVASKNTRDLFRPEGAALGQRDVTAGNANRHAESLKPIDSEKVYSSLSKLGVDYNADFALMRDIQLNDRYSATGSVEMRVLKGVPEPTVMHSCILDALGHICWGGLCASDEAKQVLVPVSVGKCYIPLGAGSKCKNGSNMAIVRGSGRPTKDSSGAVFEFASEIGLLVENMVMQPYGPVSSQETASVTPDCLQTAWIPSMDLLGLAGRKSLLQNVLDKQHAKGPGPFCLRALSEYIRVIGYNAPQATIAYLGSPVEGLLDALVTGLAPPLGTTRKVLCHRLVYASTSEDDSTAAKSVLKQCEPAVTYSTHTTWDDFFQSKSNVGAYDLVINALHQTETQELASVLQSIGNCSKRHANLVFSLSSCRFNVSELELMLESFGLSGKGLCISNDHNRDPTIYLTMTNDSCEPNEIYVRRVRVLFTSESCIATSGHVKELLSSKNADCDVTVQPITKVDHDNVSPDEMAVILDLGPESILQSLDSNVLDAIKSLASTKGLMWVTKYANSKHPSQHMVSGLARVLRIERPDLQLVLFNVEDTGGNDGIDVHIARLFERTLQNTPSNMDNEFNLVDGQYLVQRMLPNSAVDKLIKQEQGVAFKSEQTWLQEGRPLTLAKPNIRELNSISFVDDLGASLELDDHEIEIKVQAVGANFKDALTLLGQIQDENVGGECSGEVSRIGSHVSTLSIGDKVTALAPRCYAHLARCSEYTATTIPATMSFTDAASIPVSFCTAYYALHNLAHIERGETILIHTGAGALGQAAIMLAQAAGAIVYTTVGSKEKRELVVREYGIPKEQVFYSRNTSFRQGVLRATNGSGVNVVLNSLTGERLHASWDCVSDFGRMIEVGKRDILANSKLSMKHFGRNVSFVAFDLGNVALQKPHLFKSIFESVMHILLHHNNDVHLVRPITVFPLSDLPQALRVLGSGKTSGKLVVCPKVGDQITAAAPRLPETVFCPDASYLITGGTGGVGMALCKWMAQAGAKHIVLASRRGRQTPGIQDAVQAVLANYSDIQVRIPVCDVSKAENVKSLVEDLKKDDIPPIRGISHGAVVLKDVIIDRMTATDWHQALKPKVDGAWNMHNYMSNPPLDFFVMLSSVSHLHGAPSQGSYCAAGGYLEGLVHYRRSIGLSADVLELGIITDIGVFEANKEAYQSRIKKVFDHVISPAQVVAACKAAVMARLPIPTPLGVIAQPPGAEEPDWMTDPRFALLRVQKDPVGTGSGALTEPLQQQLQKAMGNRDSFSRIAMRTVVQKMSALLTLPADDVASSTPLVDLGIDSLVAIELRTWIWKEMGIRIVNSDLLGGASVAGLVEKLVDNAGAGRE